MDSSERCCVTCGAINQPDAQVCFACGLSLQATARLPEVHGSGANCLRQQYHILEQVGSGGFSSVFKAKDVLSQRIVAIKAIHLRGLGQEEIIEATDGFNREVKMLTDLRHPNLPRVYDQFSDSQNWYVVMDFIQGITLEKHLEQHQSQLLPLTDVLEIAQVLCIVLAYLHTRQPPVIFRDLKPSNVLIGEDGRLYLVDFGIARRFKPGQLKDTLPFGSPGYAAPEQYGRTQTTPRADIYSLGAMLHQLLTGEDPALSAFRFQSVRQKNPTVPGELDKLVMSMVALDAKQRPESIDLVSKILRSIEVQLRTLRVLPAASPTVYPAYSRAPLHAHHFGAPPAVGSVTISPSLPGSGPFGAPLPVTSATQWQGQRGQVQIQQQVIIQGAPLPAHAFGAAPPITPAVRVMQTPVVIPRGFRVPPVSRKRPNKDATTSLILGIASVFVPPFFLSLDIATGSGVLFRSPFFFFVLLSLTIPALAVVFGHMGRHRAKTIPGMWHGKDTATVGLILGYTFGLLYALPWLIRILWFFIGLFH